jgi:tRNA G18 (ribose-2'-O)-methylase SpoU
MLFMQHHYGVGPHPTPWPTDPRFDPELLASGDTRNVADKYRYWTVEAITTDLDRTRSGLEIAVENLERDFNMGTIIRNANAFNVSRIHIIGRRQWNKRGAMKTDAYAHLVYHPTPEAFFEAMKENQREVIAIDIVEGAQSLGEVRFPERAVLVFGAEGPGLSDAFLTNASKVVMIEQSGSTRSVNVGVASGIAIYEWTRQHFS